MASRRDNLIKQFTQRAQSENTNQRARQQQQVAVVQARRRSRAPGGFQSPAMRQPKRRGTTRRVYF